jgi:hypothetical protein
MKNYLLKKKINSVFCLLSTCPFQYQILGYLFILGVIMKSTISVSLINSFKKNSELIILLTVFTSTNRATVGHLVGKLLRSWLPTPPTLSLFLLIALIHFTFIARVGSPFLSEVSSVPSRTVPYRNVPQQTVYRSKK